MVPTGKVATEQYVGVGSQGNNVLLIKTLHMIEIAINLLWFLD